MTMTSSRTQGMVDYRRLQSNRNIESILNALQKLNKNKGPVSSQEVEEYLRKKRREEVQNTYYKGEITFIQSSEQVRKINGSMSYRTVQRHLSELVKRGVVIKKDDKYILSSIGKREIQFRNFASGYGNKALNSIMNCHFPTISSLEENIDGLVEIFGLYVVYCLNEAARLVSEVDNYDQRARWHSRYFRDSSNFSKGGKFNEERLFSSWIKNVFNPMRMLNLFLTVISNASSKSGQPAKVKRSDNRKQVIALKEYCKYYGEPISPNATILSNNNGRKKERGLKTTPAPTTLDLAFDHGMEKHRPSFKNNFDDMPTLGSIMGQDFKQMMKLIVDYSNGDRLLYDLNNDKILEVKNIMEKKYPIFIKYLRETDEHNYSNYT